jgi:D-alanyl-lipoteichoic acid acyltransferase DltB (MBOAT superfamily)
VSSCGFFVAVGFTFRLAWLLHQVHVQRTPRLPFVDLVTYFVFAPFFVIVPYMIAIPRCDRFCAGLDRHDVSVERSGLKMIALGAALTLALAWVSRLYDPMTASLEALRAREYGLALLHGLAYYPPQVIVKAVAISSILVGMVRVLGIDLGPSFVRPELARSITQWWRRWNVHFRELLVDLFYYPVLMRYRRHPVKATVLGCACVFLVGGFLFHWPKTYFSAGSFLALPVGTLTEDIVMFVIVAFALLREQRRPEAVPRPWTGIFTTWVFVFGAVVLVGYSTTAWWNTNISTRSPLPQLRSPDVSPRT